MSQLQRMIRLKQLPAFTGIKKTAIDDAIKKGEFPPPVPLNDSGRAIAWMESELIDWQNSRKAARDAALAKKTKTKAAAR